MLLRYLGLGSHELNHAINRHREAAKENEEIAERVTQKKDAEKSERDELTFVLERIARRVHEREKRK